MLASGLVSLIPSAAKAPSDLYEPYLWNDADLSFEAAMKFGSRCA